MILTDEEKKHIKRYVLMAIERTIAGEKRGLTLIGRPQSDGRIDALVRLTNEPEGQLTVWGLRYCKDQGEFERFELAAQDYADHLEDAINQALEYEP